MNSVRKLYDPFVFLLTEEPRAQVFDEAEDKKGEDYREYVTKLREKQQELAETCPMKIRLQMVECELRSVNEHLDNCAEQCITVVLEKLANRQREQFRELKMKINKTQEDLSTVPRTEKELADREMELDAFREVEVPQRRQQFETLLEWQG